MPIAVADATIAVASLPNRPTPPEGSWDEVARRRSARERPLARQAAVVGLSRLGHPLGAAARAQGLAGVEKVEAGATGGDEDRSQRPRQVRPRPEHAAEQHRRS